MGEAMDTIPSILNKCLFVSRTDRRTDRQTQGGGGGGEYLSRPLQGET